MKTAFAKALRPFFYSERSLLHEQFAFGHREIYTDYFDFPRDSYFQVELQHGWAASANLLHQYEKKNRILRKSLSSYPLLVWSEAIRMELLREGHSNVYAVASPWRLVNEKAQLDESVAYQDSEEIVNDSILYFPSHNFSTVKNQVIKNEVIGSLLASSSARITTCLYWLDFLDPRMREFFLQFSSVTCVGFRSSAACENPWMDFGGRVNFLKELRKLILKHKIIICDEFSTAAMAALILEKEVHISTPNVVYEKIASNGSTLYMKLDNEYIINGIDNTNEVKMESKFGLEISRSPRIKQFALDGFGYGVDLNDTKDILTKFISSDKALERKET